MENISYFLLNSLEIFAIAFGGPTVIMGLLLIIGGDRTAIKKVLLGATLVTAGFMTPTGPTNELPAVDEQYLRQLT